MGPSNEIELDLLDLLADEIDALLEALPEASDRTGYLAGQRAYLEEARERIQDASAETSPRTVLDASAAELGLTLEDGRLDPTPTNQRQAGILSMWSLCLGIVEGARSGVRSAAEGLEHL